MTKFKCHYTGPQELEIEADGSTEAEMLAADQVQDNWIAEEIDEDDLLEANQ